MSEAPRPPDHPASHPALLHKPNVQLFGPIDQASVTACLRQIEAVAGGDKPLVFELTTEGGDAEGGRRLALEVELCRRWHGQDTYFIGKTAVMSAGVTIMAAFPAANRYLTRDTTLLVHERRMTKTLELQGPMQSNLQIVREMVSQIETALRLEREGFAALVEGSRIDLADLQRRAASNYYLTAAEAADLGLVAGVL